MLTMKGENMEELTTAESMVMKTIWDHPHEMALNYETDKRNIRERLEIPDRINLYCKAGEKGLSKDEPERAQCHI